MSNVVGRITQLTTSSDPKVAEFDRKLAQLLAADPEKVLMQMRQHREVVAGLRAEIREQKAEIERYRRRIDHLVDSLSAYECGCGVTADTIEDHECRDSDSADREVFECR